MWVLVAAVVRGRTPGIRTEGCGRSVDGRCLQVHVSMWAKGGRCDVEREEKQVAESTALIEAL